MWHMICRIDYKYRYARDLPWVYFNRMLQIQARQLLQSRNRRTGPVPDLIRITPDVGLILWRTRHPDYRISYQPMRFSVLLEIFHRMEIFLFTRNIFRSWVLSYQCCQHTAHQTHVFVTFLSVHLTKFYSNQFSDFFCKQ